MWGRLLAAAFSGFNGELVIIDFTYMRVHQHSATGNKEELEIMTWDVPEGGLTSKLDAFIDADGRPVCLRLTCGRGHNACEAEALIEAIPEGGTLLGDKGYDSTAIREPAAAKNVWTNIPNRKPFPTVSSASASRRGSTGNATSSSENQAAHRHRHSLS